MGHVDVMRLDQEFSGPRLFEAIFVVLLLPPLLAVVIAPLAIVLVLGTWLAIPIAVMTMLGTVVRSSGRLLVRERYRRAHPSVALLAFHAVH